MLARTFAIDVLECTKCSGRVKLVAMVTERAGASAGMGAPCDVPERSPRRSAAGMTRGRDEPDDVGRDVRGAGVW